MTHECTVVRRGFDWFTCRACSFGGTLREAIAHVVAWQFTVSR